MIYLYDNQAFVDRNDNGLYHEGVRLRPGSSLFINGMNRVVWIEDIYDDTIILRAVNGTHEVALELFKKYLYRDKISIQSQPPVDDSQRIG